MKDFFDTWKFKILVAVAVFLVGIMAYAGANGRLTAAPQELLGVILTPFQKAAAVVSGGVGAVWEKYTSIDEVMEQNEQLEAENAELRQQMVDYDRIKAENDAYKALARIQDTNSEASYVSAFVIGRDPLDEFGGFTLDQGSTDGGFGPLTEKAVRAFQQKHGLPDTGIADPETLDQLEAAWCEVKGYDQPTPKATYPAHCTLDTLEDGTQQLRLCREHAQLTAKAWGLSDEETYSLWLEEWNRLYAQCVDGAAEDQRAAVAEARDWALLLIKSQRVVWRAKYDRQDAEVEARMARLIVDKCVELCRQMGSQQ